MLIRLVGLAVLAARLLVLAALAAYRVFASPVLGPSCRFRPTCSAYAMEAVRVHGVLLGLALASWRLVRCNPLWPGGYDPVPASLRTRGRVDRGAAGTLCQGAAPEGSSG